MFENKVIGFIGAGNMGGAMIGGLVKSGTVAGEQIIASDIDQAQLNKLAAEFSIQTTQDNAAVVKAADIVVLAVKPQVMSDILVPNVAENPDFILSIAAGVAVETLAELTGCPRVVRVMPNTPAMIGEGMAVWTATSGVGDFQREQAAAILSSLGETMFVAKEGLLDAATAVSGSGPAYVFLMIEAMIEAGVHLGFSRAQAEKLVLQTMKGATLYAEASDDPPSVLRAQVTSPAGTTAEALYHMEKLGLRTALARGIWAAYERSVTLGGGDGRNPD